MNKLQTIRQALETNPEVTIIDWEDVLNMDGRYSGEIDWEEVNRRYKGIDREEIKVLLERYKSNERVGIKSGKSLAKNFPSSYGDDLFHIVKYYIAPKNGIYRADELDEFMVGLIPEGLMPDRIYHNSQGSGYSHYHSFTDDDGILREGICFHGEYDEIEGSYHSKPEFKFGRLFFTEKVGEKKMPKPRTKPKTKTFSDMGIEDKEILSKEGFANSQRAIEEAREFSLYRGISIMTYPSEAVCRGAIYPGPNSFNKSRVAADYIFLDELRKYDSQLSLNLGL